MTNSSDQKAWAFSGRVLPERVPISIDLPTALVEPMHGRYKLTISTHIWQSQIVSRVILIEGEVGDLASLKNEVTGHVQLYIDIVGFLQGLSLDVEIISSLSTESDQWTVYGINIPSLAQRRQAEANQGISAELLAAVGVELHAHAALADFREAMRVPHHTGFFCFRAIESVMQWFKEKSGGTEKAAWEELRSELNVPREAIDLVKGLADAPRHGRPMMISDAERGACFDVTDNILQRYLQYITYKWRASNPPKFPEPVAVPVAPVPL